MSVWTWVATAAALAVQPVQSLPARGVTAPQLVFQIHMPEDLDCGAALQELEVIFDEAAERKAAWVLLRLEGNQARLDLAHEVSVLLKGSSVPVAVWLEGGDDHAVGAGQAVIAAFGVRAFVGPKVRCTGSVRGRLEDLAPGKVAWDLHAAELGEWAGTRIVSRRGEATLGDMLCGDPRPLWLLSREDACTLSVSAPERGGRSLVSGSPGARTWNFTAADLACLRVVDSIVSDERSVMRALDLARYKVMSRSIDVSVGRARSECDRLLKVADECLRDARDVLDLPEPREHKVAKSRYREAAERAQRRVVDALAALDEVDAVQLRVPEVLRTPAPAQGLEGRPAAYTTRWRATLRGRRADAAEHQRTIDRFFKE